MNKKVFVKNVLPLVLTFVGAVIFFISYNTYILDKSLVNLKVSLKKLRTVDSVDEIIQIKQMLDDTVLMEITKDDLSADSVASIEFASDTLARAVKAGNIDEARQLAQDAMNFIGKVIDEKESDQNAFFNFMDNLAATIDPSVRKEDPGTLQKKITQLRRGLTEGTTIEQQQKLIDLGKIYLKMDDQSEAFNYFDKATQLDKNSQQGLEALFFKGYVYKLQGEYEKAQEIFTAIKDKLPGELRALCYYEEGVVLEKLEKMDDAVQVYEDIYKKEPQKAAMAQFRGGYIYLMDVKDEKKAYDSFMDLREIAQAEYQYAKDTLIPYRIAARYRREGYALIAEAEKYYRKEKTKPTKRAAEMAIAMFDKALEYTPEDQISLSGKALCQFYLGNKREALKMLRLAKQREPENDYVANCLGFLYAKLELYEDAAEEYKQVLRMRPGNSTAHYNLGTMYAVLDQYARAKRHLRAAIAIDPEDSGAYGNLGYVYLKEGKFNEAKVNFRKASAIDPRSIEPHYNLANIFYATGMFEEARDEFLRVKRVQDEPSFRKTNILLRRIEKKLGY